jgi:predicted MPP superfamily phosphohydrolase
MRLRTIALAGSATAAYAVWETRAYRFVEHRLEVAGRAPVLSVLHISDTHLTARNRRLTAWLRELPGKLDRPPDVAIATGDMIDDDSGIEPLEEVLAHLTGRLGSFYVFGSHDYFQSTPRGALRSLVHRYSGSREPRSARYTDSDRLRAALADAGWTSLNNHYAVLSHEGRRIRIAGVDDPYLNRHRLEHVIREPEDDLAIGLVHAPDIVSEWVLAGYDLVLAGHTHGGQIRLPLAGALVTNCKLPSALAQGPNRVGAGWLHVSPGLGTSKFSPVRFLCSPEVTLLRLAPT